MAVKYQLGDFRKCINLDCSFEVIYTDKGWVHMVETPVGRVIDHVAKPHKHRFKLQPRIINWQAPHAHLWFCDCHYMVWVGKILWTRQYVGAAWPQ